MNKKRTFFTGFLLRLFSTIILLGLVLKNELDAHFQQVLYSAFIYMPLYLFVLGAYFMILGFDISTYVKQKKKYLLIPTFLGAILIGISFSINRYHNQKLTQKTLFEGNYEISNNEYIPSYSIEFKENKEYVIYEFEEQGLFTNYYYGTYNIIKNIISLDKKQGKFLKTRYFLKTNSELIEIDKKGNEIKNAWRFKIKY